MLRESYHGILSYLFFMMIDDWFLDVFGVIILEQTSLPWKILQFKTAARLRDLLGTQSAVHRTDMFGFFKVDKAQIG